MFEAGDIDGWRSLCKKGAWIIPNKPSGSEEGEAGEMLVQYAAKGLQRAKTKPHGRRSLQASDEEDDQQGLQHDQCYRSPTFPLTFMDLTEPYV